MQELDRELKDLQHTIHESQQGWYAPGTALLLCQPCSYAFNQQCMMTSSALTMMSSCTLASSYLRLCITCSDMPIASYVKPEIVHRRCVSCHVTGTLLPTRGCSPAQLRSQHGDARCGGATGQDCGREDLIVQCRVQISAGLYYTIILYISILISVGLYNTVY